MRQRNRSRLGRDVQLELRQQHRGDAVCFGPREQQNQMDRAGHGNVTDPRYGPVLASRCRCRNLRIVFRNSSKGHLLGTSMTSVHACPYYCRTDEIRCTRNIIRVSGH